VEDLNQSVGPPETLEAAKHFLFNERDGTQQAERLAQTDIHTWKETSIQPRDMDRQQDMNAVQAMNMIIDQVGHSHRTTTNGVSYFPFLSPITIFLYPAAMSRTSTPKPMYGWLQRPQPQGLVWLPKAMVALLVMMTFGVHDTHGQLGQDFANTLHSCRVNGAA
jgi:hypothetical protein